MSFILRSTLLLLCVAAFITHAQDIRFPGQQLPKDLRFPGQQLPQESRTQPTRRPPVSCYPQDSCSSRSFNSRDPLKYDERPCNCDDACAEYGDCCKDARRYSIQSAQSALRSWSCTLMREYDGIYLKKACPVEYDRESPLHQLCESNPAEHEEEPWRKLPLTSRRTQLTYRNSFCAACNNDTADPILWDWRIECDKTFQGKMKNDTFMEALHYNTTTRSWGFMSPNEPDKFITCSAYPKMPETVVDLVRRCVSFVSTCAANWTEQLDNTDGQNPDKLSTISERCRSYTTYVYEGYMAYRNLDCAKCNYAGDLAMCNKVSFRVLNTDKFNTQVFTVLFDVNERSGDLVGRVKKCDHNSVYDPFAKNCRSVLCPLPGQSYRQGKCLPEKPFPPEVSTSTEPEVIVFPIDDFESTEVSTGHGSTTSEETPDLLFTNPPILLNSSVFTTESDSSSSPLKCEQFEFNVSDFRFLENGSVYFHEYKMTVNKTDFRFDNETQRLRVCISSVLKTDYDNYDRKFSVYLAIVSLSGLGISVFCLALHLISFCLVPELQNLSGKNLASLCLSMLVADAMFIVSQFISIPAGICAVIGSAMFFCFMASFFWMNIMAFDVWRALRQATKELRVSSGRQWRKFAFYSLYGWGIPALLLALALVVDHAPSVPTMWRPAFGVQLCWFSHKRALLVFFVCPTVAIILFNATLFSLSAHMIVTTTRNTARTALQNQNRRNLKLYVRLALLMGLTWVTGIVAALIDLQPLWYLFVVLNTLQGLFIFLCFTCTPKVLEAACNRLGRLGKFGRHPRRRTFVTADSQTSNLAAGTRATQIRKNGLESRDSQDSQSSQTSRTSLTTNTSTHNSSMDALY